MSDPPYYTACQRSKTTPVDLLALAHNHCCEARLAAEIDTCSIACRSASGRRRSGRFTGNQITARNHVSSTRTARSLLLAACRLSRSIGPKMAEIWQQMDGVPERQPGVGDDASFHHTTAQFRAAESAARSAPSSPGGELVRGCPNGSWRLGWLSSDSCCAATSFPSTAGVPSWFRWALSIQRSL